MTSVPNAGPAIEVTGLRKSFGDKLVLDGIDLSVLPGQVFALLGPNGDSGDVSEDRLVR